MKITPLSLFFALPLLMSACASSPSEVVLPSLPLQDQQTFHLWAGDAPLQQGQAATDIPSMQAFLPAEGKANGAAMVIFPGGGYTHLSMVNEGSTIAKWLANNGITAFVVTYRLGMKYHYPAQMDDGQRAMRYVRAYATAWRLDPHRVGVIGFSAGGHMASMVATHFDKGDPKSSDPIERVSSRPDLQVLLYPVITMSDDAIVHSGSRLYLLGSNPSDELKVYLSGEKQVTTDTPPAFVAGSVVDRTVPIANSDNYVAALKKFNVPVVQIRLPVGGHGFGLTDAWGPQCITWLHEQKF